MIPADSRACVCGHRAFLVAGPPNGVGPGAWHYYCVSCKIAGRAYVECVQ
jgi:hypothetical protein